MKLLFKINVNGLTRFFLKGKVTQKQTTYKHKHTVREEVSQV